MGGVAGFLILVLLGMFSWEISQYHFMLGFAFIFQNANTFILTFVLAVLILIWQTFYWDFYISLKYFPILRAFSDAQAMGYQEKANSYLQESAQKSFTKRFQYIEPFTSIFKKCFSGTSDIDVGVLKMMMPEQKDAMETRPNKALSIKSNQLQEKYESYIRNKFFYPLTVVFWIGSVGLFLYLVFAYALDPNRSKEMLGVYIFIFILVTVLDFATYYFRKIRQVKSYLRIYQHALLYSSIFYAGTEHLVYPMLGLLILTFQTLHYNINFTEFCWMWLIALIGHFGV